MVDITSQSEYASPLITAVPGSVPSVSVEKLMRHLSALEPRPGTLETTLAAMADLVVAETGAARCHLEIWQDRPLIAACGDATDTDGWIEEPLHFGASKIGVVRLHGSHDQVEHWRHMGFSALATHLGGLVVAHANAGAAAAIGATRDRLLASVSHELRTPLTFISGIVDELIDAPDIHQPDRTRLLALISEQSADMEQIIEDLLTDAQAGAHRLELAVTAVDLGAEAIHVAESARIDVATLPEPGHAVCQGDPRRVRQILRNLLTNAERYGGPIITISVFRDLRRAYIAVCDDGAPIPVEQRRHLFEDFTRVDTSPRHPASVGIGLSVSRRLASLMGGNLGYEHDGRQSRFILGLPVAPHGSSHLDRLQSGQL